MTDIAMAIQWMIPSHVQLKTPMFTELLLLSDSRGKEVINAMKELSRMIKMSGPTATKFFSVAPDLPVFPPPGIRFGPLIETKPDVYDHDQGDVAGKDQALKDVLRKVELLKESARLIKQKTSQQMAIKPNLERVGSPLDLYGSANALQNNNPFRFALDDGLDKMEGDKLHAPQDSRSTQDNLSDTQNTVAELPVLDQAIKVPEDNFWAAFSSNKKSMKDKKKRQSPATWEPEIADNSTYDDVSHSTAAILPAVQDQVVDVPEDDFALPRSEKDKTKDKKKGKPQIWEPEVVDDSTQYDAYLSRFTAAEVPAPGQTIDLLEDDFTLPQSKKGKKKDKKKKNKSQSIWEPEVDEASTLNDMSPSQSTVGEGSAVTYQAVDVQESDSSLRKSKKGKKGRRRDQEVPGSLFSWENNTLLAPPLPFQDNIITDASQDPSSRSESPIINAGPHVRVPLTHSIKPSPEVSKPYGRKNSPRVVAQSIPRRSTGVELPPAFLSGWPPKESQPDQSFHLQYSMSGPNPFGLSESQTLWWIAYIDLQTSREMSSIVLATNLESLGFETLGSPEITEHLSAKVKNHLSEPRQAVETLKLSDSIIKVLQMVDSQMGLSLALVGWSCVWRVLEVSPFLSLYNKYLLIDLASRKHLRKSHRPRASPRVSRGGPCTNN
jgi:hypothetical protein